MLSLDSGSNIWVAGNALVTKIFNTQLTPYSNIIANLGGNSTSIALCTSAFSDPFSIDVTQYLAGVCTDPTDICCASGTLDAGIVVGKLDTVYTANTCSTGLVRASLPVCRNHFLCRVWASDLHI